MKLLIDMTTVLSGINLERHFLLRVRELTANMATAKGLVRLPVIAPSHAHFEIDLETAESGMVTIQFTVMTLLKAKPGPRFYPCLRVVQRFAYRSKNDSKGEAAALGPVIWQPTDLDGDYKPMDTQSWSLGLHPSTSWNADTNRLAIDCTMLDITRHWAASRINNQHYINMRQNLHPMTRFRVLACVAEVPMIWYVVHPQKMDLAKKIVPHVYFSPDDFAEMQPETNNEKYFNDDVYAVGKTKKTVYKKEDGERLELYLSVPTPEQNVDDLILNQDQTAVPRPTSYEEWRRNVNELDASETAFFWNAPLGFSKALAEGSPRQILFMPQRIGSSSGRATTRDLPKIYTSALQLLEGGVSVFGAVPRDRVQVGKLVLSCYSDSGRSMWAACSVDEIREQLGAIICMEPMDVKKEVSARVFAKLKSRGIQIHYVGRWSNGQFALDEARRKNVTLYPNASNYEAVYRYPPDEATANPYVAFRIRRFFHPDEDPTLRSTPNRPISEERQILDGLVKRLKIPADREHLSKLLFPMDLEFDNHHNYCISGGQIYRTGQPPFYGKKLDYKSFFQEAIEAIDKSLP